MPIRIRQNDADLTRSGFTLTKVKVIHFTVCYGLKYYCLPSHSVKGTLPPDLYLWFFHESVSPKPLRVVSNLFKNSWSQHALMPSQQHYNSLNTLKTAAGGFSSATLIWIWIRIRIHIKCWIRICIDTIADPQHWYLINRYRTLPLSFLSLPASHLCHQGLG